MELESEREQVARQVTSSEEGNQTTRELWSEGIN